MSESRPQMGETLYCFGILTAAGTTMIALSTGDRSIVIEKGQLSAEIQDGNKAHGQTVLDITDE